MSFHQGTGFNDHFLGLCKDFHSTFSSTSHILDLKSKQAIDRTKGAKGLVKLIYSNIPYIVYGLVV